MSIATSESDQRLSPGRTLPSRSGDGLPVVANTQPRSASTAGVIQGPAPPRFQESAYFPVAIAAFSAAMSRLSGLISSAFSRKAPSQPLIPSGAASSGEGMVCQRQASLPSATLKAATKPRMPYSPPEMPIRSLSWNTVGACVNE